MKKYRLSISGRRFCIAAVLLALCAGTGWQFRRRAETAGPHAAAGEELAGATDAAAPTPVQPTAAPPQENIPKPARVFTPFPSGPASGTVTSSGITAAILRPYAPAWGQTDWRETEPWATRPGTFWTLVE